MNEFKNCNEELHSKNPNIFEESQENVHEDQLEKPPSIPDDDLFVIKNKRNL